METPRNAGSAQPSARDQARSLIVGALTELGVPTRVRLLIDYVAARFEATVDSRAISDVRRAEQRRFDRNQGDGGPYVAPALEAVWFQPITKTLTLVEWPLARRIIGPWSERADHLRATLVLAERLINQPDRALEGLVKKMARTIPEADIDHSRIDPRRVFKAAETALDQIATQDDISRAQAARQGAQQLSAIETRWGRTDLPEDDE